jgi:hypothetical protein
MTRPRILLDCGAYSAFRLGATIDLHEYITFQQRHAHLIEHAINLDIISGPDLDAQQIKAACEQSYRNLHIMKDAGLSPWPVIHQTDGRDWLERYLNDREPYIALAPFKHGGKSAVAWVQQSFATIKQASYQPRVHGLGVTNALLMVQFPWTSVDSSTWLRQAATGNVLVPVLQIGGKPDFRLQPNRYCVTDRSEVEKNHIDKLDEFRLDDLRYFIHDICGLTLTEVRYSHPDRWRALVNYFRGLEVASGARLYFVNGIDGQMRNVLMECGAENHLLSFFVLSQLRDGMLQRYVEGTLSLPKPRRVVPDYNSDKYRRHRALAAFFRLRSYDDAQRPF